MHIKARLVAAAVAALWINVANADGSGTGVNSWIGYVFGGNFATGTSSAVAAGTNNLASGQGAFVGAGTANQANGISSLVIGGFDNRAVAIDSLVGAGAGNRATGARSVIGGGGYNLASGHYSFIGGGGRDGTASTPAGSQSGYDNIAAGDFTFIGGGQGNTSTGGFGTIAGGQSNGVGPSFFATISGGRANTASGLYSTVTGGSFNVASGDHSTVGGGDISSATGAYSTVVGGASNRASGNYSFAAGGFGNHASGDYSFAAGRLAIAGTGSFVWADSSAPDFNVNELNRFAVRATGAINMVYAINSVGAPTQYCNLIPGLSGWQCTSDRDVKENFVQADGGDILRRLASMPLYSWNFKGSDPALRSLGPTAQDFYAAFGLGSEDKTIGTTNLHGVALAAIQGLHQLVQEKDATMQQMLQDKDNEIGALKTEANSQRQEIAELRRAVEMLLARNTEGVQLAHQ